jgi:cobalt-zinc-cadmium resistance protein CzcA
MLCTLFLTRYMMPVLYSFFPAPAGHGQCETDLVMGSHYTDRFLHSAQPAGPVSAHEHGHENGPGEPAQSA